MLDKVNKDISKQRKYMDWNNMLIHLEALYVLDNALTEPEDDDLRLIWKFETDNMIKYIVDNGAGDKLTVLFTETAVLIKGFAHENSLNQFAASEWNQGIIDMMYEGLDEKMKNMFITVSGSDKKEWLPNEYRDWHETESYIAMYNGDITKWIKEKVDKMLCEIK